MDRVFHNLMLRTVDEDKRIIEGWATTGRTDRALDQVMPLGSEFDLPLPLLLDHDHTLAVGEVERAEVTARGIRFVARIRKISEPGKAKELVDQAWHYAKHGLRKFVSIGFQPLEYEPLKNGGLRFTRWSWYELSLCTVPANPDAVIETVKRAPHSAARRSTVKVPSRLPTVRVDPAPRKLSLKNFVSSADRRKSRGGVILSERLYVRRARDCLVSVMGEANVPQFQTLKALDNWDDDRQRSALIRGASWLGYENIGRSTPVRPKLPVVRLR